MQQQQAEIHRANFCDAKLEHHVYRLRFHQVCCFGSHEQILTQTQLSQRLVLNSLCSARIKNKKLFGFKKVRIQTYPSHSSDCYLDLPVIQASF